VLAQQDLHAPERISYLMCWTGIGPALTHHFDQAQRFGSEQAAMDSPAFSFWGTFLKPCPVVGDIVGRPLEWLDAEMTAEQRELAGESANDGLDVFA
jgi:hypothetical protein